MIQEEKEEKEKKGLIQWYITIPPTLFALILYLISVPWSLIIILSNSKEYGFLGKIGALLIFLAYITLMPISVFICIVVLILWFISFLFISFMIFCVMIDVFFWFFSLLMHLLDPSSPVLHFLWVFKSFHWV
jgi:hypothetical protein